MPHPDEWILLGGAAARKEASIHPIHIIPIRERDIMRHLYVITYAGAVCSR